MDLIHYDNMPHQRHLLAWMPFQLQVHKQEYMCKEKTQSKKLCSILEILGTLLGRMYKYSIPEHCPLSP